VSRKTPPHFLNNWVKNEPIWTILVHEMWKKFDISTFAFVHLTCKMYRLHGCLWFKFLDDITASYFSKLSNFGGKLYNFDLVKSSAFHKVVCGDILCMVWWTSVKRLMSISSGFSLYQQIIKIGSFSPRVIQKATWGWRYSEIQCMLILYIEVLGAPAICRSAHA